MKENENSKQLLDALEVFNNSELGMYLKSISKDSNDNQFSIPTVYRDNTVSFTNSSVQSLSNQRKMF